MSVLLPDREPPKDAARLEPYAGSDADARQSAVGDEPPNRARMDAEDARHFGNREQLLKGLGGDGGRLGRFLGWPHATAREIGSHP
jgi:hypothetical protein